MAVNTTILAHHDAVAGGRQPPHLAWLLARKPFIVPIPGTRNLDHLNENLGALRVELTSADLIEIDAALSKITVHGGRMNEMQMGLVDVSA